MNTRSIGEEAEAAVVKFTNQQLYHPHKEMKSQPLFYSSGENR